MALFKPSTSSEPTFNKVNVILGAKLEKWFEQVNTGFKSYIGWVCSSSSDSGILNN